MTATEPPATAPAAPPPLARGVILVLALACGVAVANVYFPQAISPLIAEDLDVTKDRAALVATAAQLGYATGIFLLVPLGDRLPHRRLIVTLLAITAAALLAAGVAPSLAVLVLASAVVGVATITPQLLLPMAAGLVPAGRRGAVMGTMLGGLIGGILLARAFGGVLGEALGWRAPYVVAAVLAVGLAVVLARVVPVTVPPSRERYPALLGAALRLFAAEPELRRSCLYQAAMFGAFSAAWTSLPLLITGPAFGSGVGAVGLIALVGVTTVVLTPIAGRWIDRDGSDPVNLVCILAAVLAAGVLAFGSLGGVAGLVALVAGLIVLDAAVQCGQVANQARIFALRPDARSRINTAYMTCAFLGGSAGSWLGVQAFTHAGWDGVCGLIALLAGAALARHVAHRAGLAASPEA